MAIQDGACDLTATRRQSPRSNEEEQLSGNRMTSTQYIVHPADSRSFEEGPMAQRSAVLIDTGDS